MIVNNYGREAGGAVTISVTGERVPHILAPSEFDQNGQIQYRTVFVVQVHERSWEAMNGICADDEAMSLQLRGYEPCTATASSSPSSATLPEADKSDMEFFVGELRLVLPTLGFDLFRRPIAQAADRSL